MTAIKTKNASGGNGTQADPYWATGTTAGNSWQYGYTPNAIYSNVSTGQFKPTQEQIEAGFIHYTSSVYYKTQPTVTGIKLIQANIRDLESRIANDTKDLEGLRNAEKMLVENPAWSTLLDLHNRGLL